MWKRVWISLCVNFSMRYNINAEDSGLMCISGSLGIIFTSILWSIIDMQNARASFAVQWALKGVWSNRKTIRERGGRGISLDKDKIM